MVGNMQSSPGLTRVLVIDDDRKLCRLITDYLSPLGYDVQSVHTGPEGVQRAGHVRRARTARTTAPCRRHC